MENWILTKRIYSCKQRHARRNPTLIYIKSIKVIYPYSHKLVWKNPNSDWLITYPYHRETDTNIPFKLRLLLPLFKALLVIGGPNSLEIQNASTTSSKFNKLQNDNTVRWESGNVSTQPWEVNYRKSEVITFVVNAGMNATADNLYI